MLPIGIRTSSITENDSFSIEDLKFAKEIGFDVLELSFNVKQFDYRDIDFGKRFRKEAEKLSIYLSAHAPDIFNMSSPNKNKVTDSVAACKAIIDGVSAFGVKTLVIHSDANQPIIPIEKTSQIDNFILALSALAPASKAKNIYLAVETMIPGSITSSIDDVITIIDEVIKNQRTDTAEL